MCKYLDGNPHYACLSEFCSDIEDTTLIALARKIKPDQYYDIGSRLGFGRKELEHIEHQTLLIRKDANVRMLSRWKAAQPSGDEASYTLNKVWESIRASVKSAKSRGKSYRVDRSN